MAPLDPNGPVDPPATVVFTPPGEDATDPALVGEIAARVAAGEGRRLELKRGLPGRGKVARTLAAFGNGVGGLFVVGVDDDLTIRGAPTPPDTLAELASIASEDVRPAPVVRMWIQPLPVVSVGEMRHVVVCWVPRSGNAPHAALQSDGQWEFCERRAASTRRCAQEDLRRARANESMLDEVEVETLDWILACRPPVRSVDTRPSRTARAIDIGRSRVRRALHRLESGGWVFGWGADDLRMFTT